MEPLKTAFVTCVFAPCIFPHRYLPIRIGSAEIGSTNKLVGLFTVLVRAGERVLLLSVDCLIVRPRVCYHGERGADSYDRAVDCYGEQCACDRYYERSAYYSIKLASHDCNPSTTNLIVNIYPIYLIVNN